MLHDPKGRVALQNLEVKDFRDNQDKSGSKARTKLNSLRVKKEVLHDRME